MSIDAAGAGWQALYGNAQFRIGVEGVVFSRGNRSRESRIDGATVPQQGEIGPDGAETERVGDFVKNHRVHLAARNERINVVDVKLEDTFKRQRRTGSQCRWHGLRQGPAYTVNVDDADVDPDVVDPCLVGQIAHKDLLPTPYGSENAGPLAGGHVISEGECDIVLTGHLGLNGVVQEVDRGDGVAREVEQHTATGIAHQHIAVSGNRKVNQPVGVQVGGVNQPVPVDVLTKIQHAVAVDVLGFVVQESDVGQDIAGVGRHGESGPAVHCRHVGGIAEHVPHQTNADV